MDALYDEFYRAITHHQVAPSNNLDVAKQGRTFLKLCSYYLNFADWCFQIENGMNTVLDLARSLRENAKLVTKLVTGTIKYV